MDVDVSGSSFNADRMQAKEKKRTRRDSAKSKEHSVAGSPDAVYCNSNGNVKRAGKLGDRKSRSLYGRGLPKKGGGGGKGTWGRPGDEIDQDAVLDDHDPNYDSEEVDKDTVFKSVFPEWSHDEIEKMVTPILNEYFEHAQKEEVLESLMDMNLQGQKSLVVEYLLTLALERKSEFRELASELLSFFATPLHQKNVKNGISSGTRNQMRSTFLTNEDIQKGFITVCGNLPQLILDTPDAAEVCGRFVARAVFDHIVSSNFLDKLLDAKSESSELTKLCVKEAKCLLAIPHHNLKYVWGIGGGNQPLEVLKEKMAELLKEYLSSGDSEEAIRCVRDLDVPHFHHELVYELVIMAIEVSTKRAISMLVHLLKRFYDTTIVTVDQLNQGIERVYSEMNELSIDVPNAYVYLEEFINMSYDLKVISLKLKVQAPKRTRRRFVSEGDGLRYKDPRDSYFDLV